MEKIYFLRTKDTRRIKIGCTDRIDRRWDQLSSGLEELGLVLLVHGDRGEERDIHRSFRHIRHHGEWFEASQELDEFITSFSPDIVAINQHLRNELEAAKKKVDEVRDEVFAEIKKYLVNAPISLDTQ